MVVILMLNIAWQCEHFINSVLSIIALNLVFLVLYFVGQIALIGVTPLLRIDGYACSILSWYY